MLRSSWSRVSLVLLVTACSGAATSDEPIALGELESALGESCTTDSQCGVAGVVCAPAGICVRPSNCVAGATGSGVFSGDLLVDGTDTAGDLQSLDGAWCVTGNVSVKQTALADLSGLSSLVAVGNVLAVEDNPALASLQGLDNLRRTFKLSLFRNATLGSLSALSRLTSTTSLQIYLNPALSNLDGLQGLTLLSNAEIVNNAGLTSLSGLHSVTRFSGYLDVRSNPGLLQLEGLDGLTSVGNLLQIMDNPNLSGFEGLEGLTAIGNVLRVMRNGQLSELDALTALNSARTFQVSDNAQLDACGVTELAARVGADCSACVRNGPCPPVDECPSDPDKLEPGVCGCGTPDTDSDGDGVADCVEPPACAFVPLGHLPSVIPNSAAFAVSDDGLTVAGRVHVQNGLYRAFRWRESTGMVGLHSGSTSAGLAISADGGRIAGIGGSQTNLSSQHAFREEPTFIDTLPTSSGVFDLSADGNVAVGQQNGFAMRWLQGHESALQLPFGGSFAEATGVSADGSVIVGRGRVSIRSPSEAFVWTASESIGLGDFGTPYFSSEATAVSPDGQIVVGTAAHPNDSDHGFVWTASTGLVSIGRDFAPSAVTDGAMIVGDWGEPYVLGSGLGDGPLDVLLESCGVDLADYVLPELSDVTPDGSTIVGTALNPAGRYEAVLMRIPPAP